MPSDTVELLRVAFWCFLVDVFFFGWDWSIKYIQILCSFKPTWSKLLSFGGYSNLFFFWIYFVSHLIMCSGVSKFWYVYLMFNFSNVSTGGQVVEFFLKSDKGPQ